MVTQPQKDWSRSKTIGLISLVASLIGIFAFIANFVIGWDTLEEMLKSISPTLGHENKSSEDTTLTYRSGPKTQPKEDTEVKKPLASSVEEGNKRQSINDKLLSIPRSHGTSDLSEQPAIIQELVTVSDANLLLTKLDRYNKRGLLAIGKKDDFENPNGLWVFIFDESRVYGTFLFLDNSFLNVRTNKSFSDLPRQFRDKQQIWVVESYKLAQE